MTDTPLIIAGKTYNSRLLVGSGKYKDLAQTKLATDASGADIITVAIRRTNIGQATNSSPLGGQATNSSPLGGQAKNSKQDVNEQNLLEVISPDKYTILPNTAGCYTAKDAVRTCRLARELLGGHNLVKLEVLGDKKTLYPNIMETLIAAKILVNDGFDVMVYTSDDPIIAKELENIGCCAVMPLASLIGSGQGIANPANIKLIKEQANVPVLVDAGIGCATDATRAMELGCDGVLMNSAIANAQNPILMASAMKHAVIAGRESFLAGRMMKKAYASASSPMQDLI
jgi:thiazole synthase